MAKTRKGTKTPMDPEMTGDIVEGPRGSNTGQDESQETILSSAIINELLESEEHTLNSTNYIMKQSNQKESNLSKSKYIDIEFAEYMEDDDDDDDDDVNQTQRSSQMCIMCFRIFPLRQHPWSMMDKKEMSLFIQTSWKRPPYQHIIEALLSSECCQYIPVCQHCSCFVRKASMFLKRRPNSKPKHPIHLAVEFILSGGCTPSPCHTVLNHLMESMAFQFPHNPILQMQGGLLYNTVHAVLHHIETFHVQPHTYVNFLCFIKWLSMGSQRILADQQLARLMRKYLSDFPNQEDWWKKKLPQSACRFCYGNLIPSSPPSFCSVLAQKDNLTKSIEKIESYNIIQDCVTFFCCECCRFSVVSYEYDCALRSTMGLHTTPTADAYYTRIANIFEKK